ncbi:MAG: ABC-F family ATP-binding cassette domain-containing protein [Clostridia bacterium]|nr:ABC-F family ATP-binding cassette domain-containing protein [Clostridia bacterium]
MILLTAENISKAYVERALVANVTFGINEGDKIGLIGLNGTGKSTLLKVIAGIEETDSGRIIKSNDLSIGYLPQNPDFDSESTIIDQVFRGHGEKLKVLRDYENAINSDKIDEEEIIKLSSKMDSIDGWSLESDAKVILTKLGIYNYKEKIKNLSGGQKKRVALASTLIQPTNLLILDEPTNHLDNNTIEWLEELLSQRKGALIMVTHDRYFLDRVSNVIFQLEGGNLYNYKGNYSYYMEKKLEREEILQVEEDKRKSLYKRELEWMRQGAKARTTKQKARIQRFDKLEETSSSNKPEEMNISVGSSRLGKKIIEIENITFKYDEEDLIPDFSYAMTREDRIGILGDNGTGKTTFLKLLSGEIQPDTGTVSIGETVKIGFFNQENPFLNSNQRAIDYIKEGGEYIQTETGDKITASSMMERFLFPKSDQYTPLNKLSGGEKRRLYLLRTLMQSPNVLFLDEPTNDLDIETLQVLEEYIEEFSGPVVIVSHDRYLLDKVVNKVYVLGKGKIQEFTGNYQFFRDNSINEEELNEENSEVVKKEREKLKKLKFTFNEKREWETIEDEIKDLEKRTELVEKLMINHSTEYSKLQELMSEKVELERMLEEKMDRWIYLSQKEEEIEKGI